MKPAKPTNPFPHEGGCPDCLKFRVCNACGENVQQIDRCTNGRCRDCHQVVCTPESHGYGYKGMYSHYGMP